MSIEELKSWLKSCGRVTAYRAGDQHNLFSEDVTPMINLVCGEREVCVPLATYEAARAVYDPGQLGLF